MRHWAGSRRPDRVISTPQARPSRTDLGRPAPGITSGPHRHSGHRELFRFWVQCDNPGIRHRINAILVGLILAVVTSACSQGVVSPPSQGIRATTTTTLIPASSTTTTLAVAGPLSAVSTPRSGALGHVTILATATLAGIPATETGQLEFDVSPGPYDQGQPASAEAVPTHGPGRYAMPTGYAPHRAGNWFVTVFYEPSPSQGTGPVPTVSGMPAPDNPHPDANLVTVVTSVATTATSQPSSSTALSAPEPSTTPSVL